MKFYVIFALALATVSAFDLRNAELKQHNVSVMESEGRIYNGIKAANGEFPYQVGLLLTLNDKSLSWCGGSLIDKRYVLTAAHCLEFAQSVVIYLGATKRTSPEKKVTVNRADFIIHQYYNTVTLENDIALIKFPAITYTSRTQPIRLAPYLPSDNKTFVGEEASVSGWGRVVKNGSVVEDLRYGVRLVISNAQCAREEKYVFDSTICIYSYGGVSPCAGDSGGPLVLYEEKYLIGVFSKIAINDCDNSYASVFQRVTSFVPWIRKHTGIGS